MVRIAPQIGGIASRIRTEKPLQAPPIRLVALRGEAAEISLQSMRLDSNVVPGEVLKPR